MVAEDGGLVVAEGVGDALALLDVDDHAGVVVEEAVVLEEGAGVLGDRVEQPAEGRPARPDLAVGVGGGLDVGPGRVHLRVDGEGGHVHRPVALDDLALVVHEDEVGRPDEPEGHAEGVHPEAVGALGVAGGEVAGHALVEAEAVEQPEGGGHALLDVRALLVGRGELGQACAGRVGRHGVPPAGACPRSYASALRGRVDAEAVPEQRDEVVDERLAAHRLVVDPPVAGLVDEPDDAVGPRHGRAAVAPGEPQALAGHQRHLPGDAVDERAHRARPRRALRRVLHHEPVEVRSRAR